MHCGGDPKIGPSFDPALAPSHAERASDGLAPSDGFVVPGTGCVPSYPSSFLKDPNKLYAAFTETSGSRHSLFAAAKSDGEGPEAAKYRKEVEAWLKAYKENPSEDLALVHLGKAYYGLGEYDKALLAYSAFLDRHLDGEQTAPALRETVVQVLKLRAEVSAEIVKALDEERKGAEPVKQAQLDGLLEKYNQSIQRDRAMGLSLDAGKERAELAKLEKTLAGLAHAPVEERREALGSIELLANQYLALGSASYAEAGEAAFVRRELSALAAEAYGILARATAADADLRISDTAVLYQAKARLAEGKLAESERLLQLFCHEGWTRIGNGDDEKGRGVFLSALKTISDFQAEGKQEDAQKLIDMLPPGLIAAHELLSKMDGDRLTAMNLLALEGIERDLEIQYSLEVDGNHGFFGYGAQFFDSPSRSDGKTIHDDAKERHEAVKAMFKEVHRMLENGEARSIYEAIGMLKDQGQDGVQTMAQLFYEKMPHEGKEWDPARKDDPITDLIFYASAWPPEERKASGMVAHARELVAGEVRLELAQVIAHIVAGTSDNAENQAEAGRVISMAGREHDFGDALYAVAHKTRLTDVLVELATLKIAGSVAGVAELKTLLELQRIGVGARQALVLSKLTRAVVMTNILFGVNTVKEGADHDVRELFTKEHLALSYASTLLMVTGCEFGGEAGQVLAPRIARGLGFVERGGMGLTLGGRAVSWGSAHAMGLGGMVAGSQLGQLLPGAAETSFGESFAHDIYSYALYSGAQGRLPIPGKIGAFERELHVRLARTKADVRAEGQLARMGVRSSGRVKEGEVVIFHEGKLATVDADNVPAGGQVVLEAGEPIFGSERDVGLYIQLRNISMTHAGFNGDKFTKLVASGRTDLAGKYLHGFGLKLATDGGKVTGIEEMTEHEKMGVHAPRKLSARARRRLIELALAPASLMLGVGGGGSGVSDVADKTGNSSLNKGTPRPDLEAVTPKASAEKTSVQSSDPRALEALLILAKDGDREVRMDAAAGLGKSSDPRALDALLKLTKDEYWSVRRNAAIGLGQSSDPRALEALLILAKDGDREVRMEAAAGLGKSSDPRALDALLKLTKDENWSVRRNAAIGLGQSSDPRALEALIKLVQDGDEYVRHRAANGLGQSSDPRALEALLKLAKDGDAYVRRGAAEGLGQSSDPRALEALLILAKDGDAYVRMDAAEGLGESSDPRALEALLILAKDGDVCVRMDAAEGLGESSDPRALEALLKLAKDGAWRVRKNAAEGLGESSDPRALEALLKLAKDGYEDVRHRAANGLGKSSDPRALEALLKLAKDGYPNVRRGAAQVLGKSSDPRALEALLKLAKDGEECLRMDAAEGLGESSDPRALEALIKLVQDGDEYVRCEAVEGLGKSSDPRAVDALRTLLKDSSQNVIYAAAVGLERLARSVDPSLPPPPHPARKAAALTRAVVSRMGRGGLGLARGFANRGHHPGQRPESDGFDFRENRETQRGEPVSRPRYVNGRWVEPVFQQTQAINNMIVVDPRALSFDNAKSVEITVGAISEMNIQSRDGVGFLIGDGKDGRYQPPSQKKYTTEHVLKAVMDSSSGASQPAGGVVGLMEQNLARQHLPRGSRVYLVADFAREPDLEGVGRVIKHFAAAGVTVVPVQAGEGHMEVPREVVRIGSRKYYVDEADTTTAEQRGKDVASFLRKYGGSTVSDTDAATAEAESISAAAEDLVRRTVEDADVRVSVGYRGEEIIDIPETATPPEVMEMFKRAVREENVLDLQTLVVMAKHRGWGTILDWVQEMSARSSVQDTTDWLLDHRFRDPSPDVRQMNEGFIAESRGNGLNDVSFLQWGPRHDDVERALAAAEKERTVREQQQGDHRPESGFGAMVHSLFQFLGIDSSPAPSSVSGSRDVAGMIARHQEIRIANTGAMESGEAPGRGRVWLKLSQPLEGRHQYLALGIFGKYDAAHGTYSEVPGFALDDLSSGGGTKVSGKVTDAEGLVDMPVPLGGRIVKHSNGRVNFELSASQPRADVMDMKLADFRAMGRDLYGEQYDTLTESVPLESMPPDVRALIESVEGMTVRDAMRTIQRFMVEKFEYREFDDAFEKPIHESIAKRAAAGGLTGPNEFLNFILQTRAGKCVEISEMTMALLRLAGIPSAKFDGYVASGRTVDREAHAAALAVLPREGGGFTAEPVEGSWKYLSADDAAEVSNVKLPEFVSSEQKGAKAGDDTNAEGSKRTDDPAAPEEASLAPEVSASEKQPSPAKEEDVEVARVLADEAGESAVRSPTVREQWQSRWDAASPGERAAISKAWEYYVYCLMYRGHTFGGTPVVEMMLDPAQYARFTPGVAQPPSYWMEYIETAGLTPTHQDLARFQDAWQQRIH